MLTIQGQYAQCCVMIDEIDEAPEAYKPMQLIRSAISPAVEQHEVLPEIYNLKGR